MVFLCTLCIKTHVFSNVLQVSLMLVVLVYLVNRLVKPVEVKSNDVRDVFLLYLKNISMELPVMKFVLKEQLQMTILMNAQVVKLVVQFVCQMIQKYVQSVMILYIYSKTSVLDNVLMVLDLASLVKLVNQKHLFLLFTFLFGFQLF